MSGINKVKIKVVKIDLGNKKRKLVYDFNALGLIEELHGDIDETFKKLESNIPIALLRDMIWAGMANEIMDLETGDMKFSRFQVGAWIQSFDNINVLMESVAEAFNNSMPEPEKDEESNKSDGGKGN